jgi:cyclophilin family peptidyl-prolyl cis-trans isomerase
LQWFDQNTGALNKAPYYDGIPVHRAEAGMLFEAGDRTGTGYGAPDINVPPETGGPVDFSLPGRLGMARGAGHISGVLFFVTASGHGWLNRYHPCFGEVVSGLDVVLRISTVKTQDSGRPLDPPTIQKIRIFKVGEPAGLPEPQPYYPERLELEE